MQIPENYYTAPQGDAYHRVTVRRRGRSEREALEDAWNRMKDGIITHFETTGAEGRQFLVSLNQIALENGEVLGYTFYIDEDEPEE